MKRLNSDNFKKIHVGRQFKNFSDLCREVTGEKPPTGKKNQDAIKREMSRFIEFKRTCEIDPTETSKLKLTITAVHDSPQVLLENRGRRGKYSDYMRPLLLRKNSFCGKLNTLLNEIGIFSRYHKEITELNSEWYKECKIDPMEVNLWKIDDMMFPGERQYRNSIWFLQKQTLERNLEALEKAGLIKLHKYYQLLPAIVKDVPNSKYRRFLDKTELAEREQERHKAFAEFKKDPNFKLTYKDICLLDITETDIWCNPISLIGYKYQVVRDEMRLFPIKATKEQEDALRKIEIFWKQATMKKVYNLKSYPPEEDIPNDFFRDTNLREEYRRQIKATIGCLTGCKSIWTEIEYTVVATNEEIEDYLKLYPASTAKESATILTKKFIKYMDKRMSRITYMPTAESLKEDSKMRVFGMEPRVYIEKPLLNSKSACMLHEKLKKLYDIR